MQSFDGEELIGGLDDFVRTMPQLLRRTAATSSFADELESMNSGEESAFTLAVVGQMRSGKSTLINTLINDHSVAKVGITETTATVNWIRYGDEEARKSFKVHWKSVPATTETLARGEDEKWVGDSELCARTRFLEFFSKAEFLKRISLIDTPGTQSVIEQHETTIQEFISAKKKCDDETMYYGGMADCLIYVLPPIAKAHDSELLERFGQDTRIQGASAYNSIGVLNRWEAVLNTDRPWEDVYEKAKRMNRQLGRFVSDIRVVSGPLHCAFQGLGEEFWEDVMRFVSDMSDDAFAWSLGMEKRFLGKEEDNCAWSLERRVELYRRAGQAVGFVKNFPWQSFSVMLKFTKANSFRTAQELRLAVGKLAGIDDLLEILDQRFFQRSRVIRATSWLKDVLSKCHRAVQSLGKERAGCRRRLRLAQDAQQEVAMIRKEMSATHALIGEVQQSEEARSQFIHDTQKAVEDQTRLVHDQFLNFDKDMKAMALMDSNSRYFSNDEQVEILRVLGAYGLRLNERFQLTGTEQLGEETEGLESRHALWVAKCEPCVGVRQQVLGQVIARFEEAINYFHQSTES